MVLPDFRTNLLFALLQDLYQSPSCWIFGIAQELLLSLRKPKESPGPSGFRGRVQSVTKTRGQAYSSFQEPRSSRWSIVLTALEDGKCLELAIVLMYGIKGQDKDLSKVRGSVQVLELCLQSAQSCLSELKLWGLFYQLLCATSQGAQDEANVVAVQSSQKSLKSQPVLKARRMCSAQRHHQQSLTEGSITLQVKIFVFLLCLPSKNLMAICFSSVLMIDFSWMLGWELF